MNIDITIPNLERLQSTFSLFPEIAGPFLRTASMQSAFEVEKEAKLFTPVDTGRLRATIATSLGVADLGLTSIVSTNVNYALAVHEGSKPHAAPYAPIKAWAKRHGVPAGAVWWSIKTKSRKGRPFMKQGAEKAKEAIERYYGKALTNTVQEIAKKVQ